MKRLSTIITFVLVLSLSGFAQQIPFQGRLLDDGRPFNGTATIDFSIISPAWSETKADVAVVDGYYSVVLGSTTPFPDDLFGDSREVSLNITVNGESLGAVTLHSPLLPYTAAAPVEIDSIFSTAIRLFNASDNPATYLQAGTEGATIQLSAPDATDTYNRATLFGGTTGSGENSFLELYGLNPTDDGQAVLISNYTTANDVFFNPFTGGYRRGGTDYYDNEGTFLAGIGSNRDEAGGDPSGKSGLVIVNGPTTRNAYVSGQWWDNSELGIVQVFGQNDNGAGDFSANIELVADDQAGETSGRIVMFNTANGGTVNETVFINSNNSAGEGFFALRDASGNDRIALDGGSGNISANRTDGGSAANFFVASDNGGIAIQNASNQNKFFYEANAGNLELRDDGGTTTIIHDGNLGNISANGDVSGNTLTSSDGMVQTSDRRLKKNIQDLASPLENTLQMRGVSYQWKDENKSQRNQIGVIAQEVEEIYPEFVFTNDKGMKAVNYAQMTAVLIEAIKELNAKVEKLESENTSLKASLDEVKALRSEMDHLMKMLGGSKAASK